MAFIVIRRRQGAARNANFALHRDMESRTVATPRGDAYHNPLYDESAVLHANLTLGGDGSSLYHDLSPGATAAVVADADDDGLCWRLC